MKTCKTCSAPLVEKLGDFTHIIFGVNIVVEDVPYIGCETCGGDLEYVSTRTVDFLIRDAYRAQLTNVKFGQ